MQTQQINTGRKDEQTAPSKYLTQVLIVEDSPTQAQMLNISLRRLSIGAERVGTLNDALIRFQQPNFDVVLLDLSLPDSSGLNTFQKLHAQNRLVPIVVLTGLDDQTIALQAVKEGAQDYLIKGRASEDSIVRCLRYAVERARAELALIESEKRTRLIIENSLDAFMAVDENGIIIDWNLQAEKLFGYAREEVLGKYAGELIRPGSFRRNIMPDFKQLINDRSKDILNRRTQGYALGKNGGEFIIEFGIFAVKDGSKETYCGFINDITERKELERKRRQINQELEQRVEERTADLTRSNEELHQFAKIASHDLQEPLRAVQGFANLLNTRYRAKLDNDAGDFIDFILDGTARMQQLIQAVLEHSSIHSSREQIPLNSVNSALQEAIANLNQSITESAATVTIGQLPLVPVERPQLIQLFQNLISNGLKYTEGRPPHIVVSAELHVDQWLFSVQDNGIGIDSRYAEKIFDMFARLHGRTKYSGTGMGLAICKKIVTAHGGKIWMESEPGQGSIFFFTLPAQVKVKEKSNA
jgi:PAS domain S-box-containing protein